MNHRKKVTIRDVAAQAGVSHQTVSRVLNESEHVLPETRERVLNAMRALGYRPNAIARSLAAGQSHLLGCIAQNLTDYTFACIIEGAERYAREFGYYLLSASAEDETSFKQLIEQLVRSGRIDGLMVTQPYLDQRFQYLPGEIPVVVVGARARESGLCSVMVDNAGGTRQALEHLLALGHRQIAMITGPCVEDCVLDRNEAYQNLLKTTEIGSDPRYRYEGDWSASSGYAAVKDWLAQGLPFTAIFAQNDRMAIGAIHALHEQGKRVPEDVSVVGFDDMPLSAYFDPPLTTVRQDFHALGREAARLLLQALENEACSVEVSVPTELVVRQSTQAFSP